MKKEFKTILSLLIAVIFAGVLFVPLAFAQSGVDIQFQDDPLFNEANFLPGDSVTRWVKVVNNMESSVSIAAEAINYDGFPNAGDVPSNDLSRALNIVIREKEGSNVYGKTTLFDFYQNGQTYLSDVLSNETKEYEFEISFPEEKGNDWKGKTTYFDIIVGIQGQEGGDDNGENGGTEGGTSGSSGAVILPPGLTITNENVEVIIEGCDALITWNTSYRSTSRVIYAPEDGNRDFDLSDASDNPPLYGYDYTSQEKDNDPKVFEHSVLLEGLTPNTNYHYRCISHASPPTISKELEFDTFACICDDEEEGIVAGTSTDEGGEDYNHPQEEGYPKEVAGESVISSGEGDVEGTTTDEDKEDGSSGIFLADIGSALEYFGCLPWWLILILALYPLYKFSEKRDEIKKAIEQEIKKVLRKKQKIWLSWCAFLVIFALILYWLGYWCIPWWLLILLILICVVLRVRFNEKKQTERV